MKITRFAQSCVLIETKGKRIIIDPGSLQYKETYPRNEWTDIDAILVTHKHTDHCHTAAIKEITQNPKTKLYTTSEVAGAYPELSPTIVKEGDVVDLEDIKIEVVRAVHGYNPVLKGGREIYENVGYIVDDGDVRAYQTSDTICFQNDYTCDVLFLPVNDHGLAMGPIEAALFAKETGAKLIIPIHYDNPRFPADLKVVEEQFGTQGLKYEIMEIEQSLEI